jgi:hypothetical protein
MANTTRTYTGNGVTTLYPVDFTLGYISKDYVYVYLVGSEYTDQLSYNWIDDTQIELTTPVEDGVEFIIRRVVPRGTLVNDYEDGAILREQNLDDSFRQGLMVQEEVADGFFTVGANATLMNGDLDMRGHQILSLPDPVDDNDPIRLKDLLAYDPSLTEGIQGLLAVTEELLPVDADTVLYTFPDEQPINGSAFYIRSVDGDTGTKLIQGYDYVLRPDIDAYTLELSRSWNTGSLLQRVYNSFSGGDTSVPITSGVGDPEGTVSAVVGTLYSRTDGLPNETLYIKESGNGNTGWVAQGSFDGSVQEETLSITAGTVVYSFPTVRELNGSAFFIREPNGDLGAKLIQGVDYTLRADINPYTLELTRQWDAGNILQRVYNDFAGATTFSASSNKPVFANITEAQAALTFGTGYEVVIPSLGNARYILRDNTYTALDGDITRSDGKVWELQPTNESEWNVLWFGATSDLSGTTIATPFFDAAATRAGNNGVVIVPKGGFKIDAPIGQAVTWKVQPATEIYGLGGVAPSSERDLTHLTGSVLKLGTTNSWNSIRVGDPKYTVQKLTNKSFSAEIEGHSDDAAGGVLGTTYASARTTVDSSRHALTGIAVNDSADLTGAWATYLENYILAGSDGNSFCVESTTFNANNTINVVDTPNLTVVGRQGLTYNVWLTTGGDPAFGETMYDTTAALGILGKEGPWGAKYDKGIICKHDSIASSDFCAIPTGLQYTWWKDNGFGDKKRAFIEGQAPVSEGQLTLGVLNAAEAYVGMIVTPTQISCNDNVFNLGAADRRWKEVFAVNGTINTSDERQKEQIESLSATEKAVGLVCKGLIKKFKWKDAVLEKGSDARIHVGVIAQEVQQAFTDAGLDADDYGLFTYDNDNGEDIFGIRYTELLCFIMGAID